MHCDGVEIVQISWVILITAWELLNKAAIDRTDEWWTLSTKIVNDFAAACFRSSETAHLHVGPWVKMNCRSTGLLLIRAQLKHIAIAGSFDPSSKPKSHDCFYFRCTKLCRDTICIYACTLLLPDLKGCETRHSVIKSHAQSGSSFNNCGGNTQAHIREQKPFCLTMDRANNFLWTAT